MAGPRSRAASESLKRRTDLKERAAAARTLATATKAWHAHVTAAAEGSMWRVTSTWIEQNGGLRCADLTHVGTGKVRTIKRTELGTVEECRAQIAGS